MASRISKAVLALAVLGVPLSAQEPATLRLSFADAIRRVSSEQDAPPSVELAGLRTEQSRAQVTQARSGLLPSLSVGGLWSNRTLNPKSLGFSFPGLPSLIGPFDV